MEWNICNPMHSITPEEQIAVEIRQADGPFIPRMNDKGFLGRVL